MKKTGYYLQVEFGLPNKNENKLVNKFSKLVCSYKYKNKNEVLISPLFRHHSKEGILYP